MLTWVASQVRVRCPFDCDANIHRHGFTRPEKDSINARIAHCIPKVHPDGSIDARHYRLVFPFETAFCTMDLWWVFVGLRAASLEDRWLEHQ